MLDKTALIKHMRDEHGWVNTEAEMRKWSIEELITDHEYAHKYFKETHELR